jgi:hypothetical protein
MYALPIDHDMAHLARVPVLLHSCIGILYYSDIDICILESNDNDHG